MKLYWFSTSDEERPGAVVYKTKIPDTTFNVIVSETSVNAWQYMMFEGDSNIPTVMSEDYPLPKACMEAFEDSLDEAASKF